LPHFSKDTAIEGRIFHRPIRLTLELIEKLNTSSKIATLNFIIKNCQRINHGAFIIHECFRSYSTQKEFIFEPIADLEIISKEFISKVQSLPIHDLFENVDDEKNDIMFNLIKKYGDILLLQNELKVFIEYESANGLSFMKSLIPMSYYNFSNVGEYGHEIGNNIFEFIESFVSREILKNSATKLFPEFENLDNVKSADFFEKREVNKNKEIINQYLLFIISRQNQTKQLAEAIKQNS